MSLTEAKTLNKEELVKAAIFGVAVGDALGVPVEFKQRSMLKLDPVTDMRGYGTHHQPEGTWSDDSSMMLANMDSMLICGGIDYADIMTRFVKWRKEGAYTPYGRVFDIGITCDNAISRFSPGADPLECGMSGERENGNGSLMRIMPVSLYFAMKEDLSDGEALTGYMETVQNVSRLTHAHPRSMIGCVIYTLICHELIYREGRSLGEAVSAALSKAAALYSGGNRLCKEPGFLKELMTDAYGRMGDVDAFAALPENEIRSSGYVVHTLEAAVWCLLNTASYAECTLKAVNLGEDTDTVGAVAGGLAGIAYGYKDIPEKWLASLAKKDMIEDMCLRFADKF